MEEYPANSRTTKDATKYTNPRQTAAKKTEEPARAEKIVMGEVTRRKMPLGKRITQAFFGGESHGVWNYIAYDVMIPAAKDMVADAVTQGVERRLWGEVRSASRRHGSRPGYTAYNRAAAPYRPDPRTAPPRPALSARARATHNFEEVVVGTRAEAEAVINSLFDRIEEYGSSSVSDLYDMLGTTSTYIDRKWGWVDLATADVKRVREGYLLELPRPVELD